MHALEVDSSTPLRYARNDPSQTGMDSGRLSDEPGEEDVEGDDGEGEGCGEEFVVAQAGPALVAEGLEGGLPDQGAFFVGEGFGEDQRGGDHDPSADDGEHEADDHEGKEAEGGEVFSEVGQDLGEVEDEDDQAEG